MNGKSLLMIGAILLLSTQFILNGQSVFASEINDISSDFEFPEPKGPASLLVILLEFTDNRSNHDPSVIREQMFGSKPSMNDYWKETSYGNFYFIDDGVWKWIEAWDDPSTVEDESTREYWDSLSDYGAGKFRWWGIKSLFMSENFDFTKFDKNNDQVIILGDEVSYIIVDSRTMSGGSDRFLVDNDKGKIPNWNVTYNDLMIGNIRFAGRGAVAHGGEIESSRPFLVMTHELAHNTFGFADYYAGGVKPENIQMFSLMGDYYGPHHLDAYSKYKLGWIRPTVVISDGFYILPDSETNPNAFILYDPNHGSDEYFLVENRFMGNSYDNMSQFLNSTDMNIQDEGLVIWHIDETRSWNGSATGGFSPVQLLTRDGNLGWVNQYISSAFDGSDSDYYNLNDDSAPRNLRWWGGQPSGIGIYAVSESNDEMMAYFDIPGSIGIVSWFDNPDIHVDPSGSAIFRLNVLNTGVFSDTVRISVENLDSSLSSSIISSTFILAAGELRVLNIVVTGPYGSCSTPIEFFNFDVIAESTTYRVFKQIHYASLNTSFVDQRVTLVPNQVSGFPGNWVEFDLYYLNGGNVDGDLYVEFEAIRNSGAQSDLKELKSSWVFGLEKNIVGVPKCLNDSKHDYFRIWIPDDWAGLTDTIYEFNIVTNSNFGYEVKVKGSIEVKATTESMLRYNIIRIKHLIADSKYQSLKALLQSAADKSEFAMVKYRVGNLVLAGNLVTAAQNEVIAYKNEVNAFSGNLIDYKLGMLLVYDAEKLTGELEQTKSAIFSDVIIGQPSPPLGSK